MLVTNQIRNFIKILTKVKKEEKKQILSQSVNADYVSINETMFDATLKLIGSKLITQELWVMS